MPQKSLKVAPVDDAETITELMAVLESIETDNPLAELNATSISDNNGSRIEL